MQGCLSPLTAMALFPNSHAIPPHFSATPQIRNCRTFFTQFCAVLCVFSVNFGSWQSDMTPKNKIKYKWGWKSTLHVCIYKWMTKRNRARVASEKIFQKMIGRLYKANTCLSNLISLPLICPQTFMKICMFFVPLFKDAGCVYASMELTPLQTGRGSLGINTPPSS